MKHIKIKKPWDLTESQVTSEQAFWSRRKFLQSLSISGIGSSALANGMFGEKTFAKMDGNFLQGTEPVMTSSNEFTGFHNFVEFSQWNAEVLQLAQSLDTSSWPVTISGMIENPMTVEAGELTKMMQLQQRIYRFRCIEGWSMVVPWSGFPLKRLIELAQPNNKARYVRFVSFYKPDIAPGQHQDDWYVWPYTEALSIEEANHDLSFIATGVYGKELPKEQGAPFRLIVPWKYAIKSIKSITSIEFIDKRPETFWEVARPGECDFNCNVDPNDPNSKFDQKREISIDTGDWQPTELYNGYAKQVSSLYI